MSTYQRPMLGHKLAPIGVDLGDGRLIALDAELTLPEVVPIREVRQYDTEYLGRAENARIFEGYVVADIHFKNGFQLLSHRTGLYSLAPDWGMGSDWELFEEKNLAVMVKGELRGLTLDDRDIYPWGAW